MVRRWLVAALVAGALVFPALGRAQDTVGEDDLVRASDGRTVRVGSPSTGRVVTLPIEVYVARVLAGEGEPNAPEAAHRALAVAIRTFAAANALRHRAEGFELCDETHCQVLRVSTEGSRRAALATAGAVLLYRGVPAELFYSASCGGRTERAADLWSGIDFPYLQSAIDDVHEADEPWTVDLSLQQIQRALQRAGFAGTRLRDVRVESRSVSARVNWLRIDGMRPAVITGEQFRPGRRGHRAGEARRSPWSAARAASGSWGRGVRPRRGHVRGRCRPSRRARRDARRDSRRSTIPGSSWPI